jgi:hypothetical protein
MDPAWFLVASLTVAALCAGWKGARVAILAGVALVVA